MAGSAGHPRAFCRYPDAKRGWSRLAAGTGNGNPSTTACPRTRSCAWHWCVHVDAGGTSTASSPKTPLGQGRGLAAGASVDYCRKRTCGVQGS